ncbi:helix-turn-helix domain-containing protein [Kitasatospora sp. NPDC098663]|uniref:helix-turn-helix domain-containing protein n=1 Tax=Kitasatospora sp. NPDC098663 TaxID=3364096 RepID=UPI00380FC05E
MDTVRSWRKRFTAERLAALVDRPRPLGRPRLSAEDKLQVIAAATARPPTGPAAPGSTCREFEYIHHTPEHTARRGQVELFFSTLTRRPLRRGQFASRDELAAAVDTFVLAFDEHDAGPYRWTCDGSPLKAA